MVQGNVSFLNETDFFEEKSTWAEGSELYQPAQYSW